ncbi:FAD-dependent oxidoreductase [Hymenobacter busanensis]|uniref:long-chain-alcohol oxidase n=1 Tax=Hymenobacter busanensis TaxID=2607656 RepID=A0A7L4ZX14_9BACT|nr:FAD-dependent oxidoreductase [Hymenobacter busanensis]KAA9333274.1 FAD-dependent oxidoreductase [Hymenobacter busanensis]QHJ08049.1 FAD-binding protein [Hymenobacter busanensis]
MTFSAEQRRTLAALADTFVPAIPAQPTHHDYWARAGSEGINFDQLLAAIEAQPEAAQRQFEQLLDLLGSPLLGFTWFGPTKPFVELKPAQREQLLQSWAGSLLPPLRQGFQALRKLCVFLYYGGTEANQQNPSWSAIGYPGPAALTDGVVDTPRPLATLQPTRDTTYDCDVLVIGSGAGGGVVAGELAAAGYDVLVLEKGPYCHGCDFTQREADMLGQLYDARGTLSTTDGGITLLAGSCLGGGTTVNWAGAFRTPDYVLEEWAHDHQAPHFTQASFKASLEAVAAAVSVNTDYPRHNGQNQALLDGSRKLGHDVRLIPRNEKGLSDSEADFRGLGYSTFGDRYGIKQGTLNTYLKTAAEHGARLLPNTRVERITTAAGQATGAEAVCTAADGRPVRVTVRAQRVVVAGGAIQTPALLLRSGLQHPHLGHHLHLHPTVAVSGVYPWPIEAWYGPSMSVVNDSCTRLNGTNFGAKIETPPAHAGLMAMTLPWLSGEQHKRLMQDAAHLGSFIVLTRDRDGGRVRIDRHGTPLIDYRLSAFDRDHLLTAVRTAAEVHAAAGAHTVYLPHGTLPTLHVRDGQIQNRDVLDGLPQLGWRPNQFSLYSAHQMSTCRMGGSRATHPTSPTGETYEVRGLYVADGSAFPACSGVNPMLTIMALAHHTAQHLKADLPQPTAFRTPYANEATA